MKPAAKYFLMGLFAGLPLNLIFSIMRWSQAQIAAATQAEPPMGLWSVLFAQTLISLAAGFAGWRWGYLPPVRWALGVAATLSIPSAIVGGWLGYTRMIAGLM